MLFWACDTFQCPLVLYAYVSPASPQSHTSCLPSKLDCSCAENWDANIFCQERTQVFKLSGRLNDQVELTETGRSLVENRSQPQHSPRPTSATAATPSNQAATDHQPPRNQHDSADPDSYAKQHVSSFPAIKDTMQLQQSQPQVHRKPLDSLAI